MTSAHRGLTALPTAQNAGPGEASRCPRVVSAAFCGAKEIKSASSSVVGRPLSVAVSRASSGHRRGGALATTCSSQSVSQKFAELRAKNEVALIPFIVAGDPDIGTTERALKLLCETGADVIELGVPYSDPLADGPVIQASATRALASRTDLQSVIDLLKRVTPSLPAPIVLFTYYNPIMKRGVNKFMAEIKAAGAAGIVVPDVPLEETSVLRELATANGLELVLLTTPTTPTERMGAIADVTQGFLYLVSLTGVTGEREAVQGRVEQLLKDIKATTDKPVAVGFGISAPEHAEQVVSWGADGVIVGSALVKLLGGSDTAEEGLAKVGALMRSLKAATAKNLQTA
ncbi:unnamed protein product [Closterium sp. Yama58-4]|nr:unnamed protein product [Closterium sp. Yama58-4]